MGGALIGFGASGRFRDEDLETAVVSVPITSFEALFWNSSALQLVNSVSKAVPKTAIASRTNTGAGLEAAGARFTLFVAASPVIGNARNSTRSSCLDGFSAVIIMVALLVFAAGIVVRSL